MLFELNNVSRTFYHAHNEVRALEKMSFRIHEGEFVVVIGPSGCGKTTLLHILGLLDLDFEGELIFRGRSMKGLGHSLRARLRLEEIGFVFQKSQMLESLDVLDNAALPGLWLHGNRRKAYGKAEEILHRLGLGHRLHHKTNRLSEGEIQRAAMARALINEPSVLLADEPTGNLDAENTRSMLNLFSQIRNGNQTLVIITHDPEVAEKAERRIVLRYGNIIEDISCRSPH
ncbi:MAG: ABC transporter ATP-binding protein [Pseudomonadota bacterium]